MIWKTLISILYLFRASSRRELLSELTKKKRDYIFKWGGSSSVCIFLSYYFHPFSFAFIHIHPLSSISTAFIPFQPLSSTFTHFRPLSYSFIHFEQLLSTFFSEMKGNSRFGRFDISMPYQVEWLRLRIALNRTPPRPLEHALTESHGLSHGYLAWQMFLSQKFITKFLSHGYMTWQMFLVRRVSWLWFKETLEWILSGSFTGWGYWWRVFWGSWLLSFLSEPPEVRPLPPPCL